jgi:magnesium-transporting ATPase (P-type)
MLDVITHCGRWMIVMSNLVPISLIFTVELVRFIQALFMQWDIDLIDKTTGI